MVNESIVSDFLSLLGINLHIENESINRSYTFSCLEFKRILNHFPIVRIHKELDLVLQAYNIGTRSYSLLNANDFKTINVQECLKMEAFIDNYKQKQLIPLLNIFKDKKQLPIKAQCLEHKESRDIVQYLKQHHMNLYMKLRDIIHLNKNVVFDYGDQDYFFSLFD